MSLLHFAAMSWAVDPSNHLGEGDSERGLPPIAELPPQPGVALPVVGGAPAEEGVWPDAAAVFIGEDFFACSGVLVAPDVVLTAAHCKGGMTAKHVRLDTVDHTTDDYERIEVLEAFAYDDPYRTFDIAALVLAEPAQTAPRRLLRDCFVEDYLSTGADVSIVGFGALDEWGLETTSVLHEAVTQVNDPDCADLTLGCNDAVSPGGELMAGGDGTDSCVGDSGGPLYVHTPDGPFLVGITSRAALPAPTTCGHGGIYVRTDAIASWVEEVTQRTLWAPDCGAVNRPPRPFAEPMEIWLGQRRDVWIDPGDPNPDDVHTFEIVGEPIHGEAEVSEDGQLTFRTYRHVFIDTTIEVLVTDQEGAVGSVVVEVDMRVPPDAVRLTPGCGCASPSPLQGGAVGALVLFSGIARRRRS